MLRRLKYVVGLMMIVPVAPIIWWQGRQILKRVPSVPEPDDSSGAFGAGEPSLKLLAIGESSIASIGASTSGLGLVGQTAQYLAMKTRRKISWKVIAESGLTIKKMLTQLIPLSQKVEFHPDMLILGVGVNEIFKLNHPVGFRRDLETLIHVLKTSFPEKPIVFIHMPPIRSFPVWTPLLRFFTGELGDIFEDEMEQVINAHSHTYYCTDKITLDGFKAKLSSPTKDADFFSDGVHPSELTYRLWGEEIGSFIMREVLR